MLIVNADDYGRDECATDRALACFSQARISSTTAMVFMSDSARAAQLAPPNLGIGLHINFSEEFSSPDAPRALRTAHRRVARFLKRSKHTLLLYHPLLARDFRTCFVAQRDEFARLYGRSPTHFDGHQHYHLSTNVLLGRLLPRRAKVRRSFTFFPHEKDWLNRSYRRLVDQALARRHIITDYFFSLAHYLDADRLARVVSLSQTYAVELMTHPALNQEFDFLSSEVFRTAIAKTTVSNFNTLGEAV